MMEGEPADAAAAAPAGAPGADAGGMDNDQQCVPLDALAMPDEQEQMNPPAVGDSVSYQVEGKVVRIDGKNAYVEPTAINGQPVADDEAAEAPEPDEAQQDANDFQDLQQQAQQQGPMS
jgi:hypothetical protein